MYSGLSAHEASTRTIAGPDRVSLVDGVRFDWPAAAAIAGVAATSRGPAGGTQRRQSHAYVDHSAEDHGPAERALLGKNSDLP